MSGEPIKIITAGGYTFAKFCKAGSKSKINTEMVNTISYTIVIVTTVNNIDSHSNSPLESCGSRDLSSYGTYDLFGNGIGVVTHWHFLRILSPY